MTNLTKIGIVVAAGLLSGCTLTIRNVTATYLTQDGLYVGYWEGTCKPIIGCGAGDGKAKWCSLNADNSLTCTEQTAVSEVLARKNN
jgi:hypothetical protein